MIAETDKLINRKVIKLLSCGNIPKVAMECRAKRVNE
jgi:hypothetical protein